MGKFVQRIAQILSNLQTPFTVTLKFKTLLTILLRRKKIIRLSVLFPFGGPSKKCLQIIQTIMLQPLLFSNAQKQSSNVC